MRESRKRLRSMRIAAAKEQLGNCCMDCGETDERLHFHHRDSSTKIASVAWLWDRPALFWAEVAKCDLLCFRCHFLRHLPERANL